MQATYIRHYIAHRLHLLRGNSDFFERLFGPGLLPGYAFLTENEGGKATIRSKQADYLPGKW